MSQEEVVESLEKELKAAKALLMAQQYYIESQEERVKSLNQKIKEGGALAKALDQAFNEEIIPKLSLEQVGALLQPFLDDTLVVTYTPHGDMGDLERYNEEQLQGLKEDEYVGGHMLLEEFRELEDPKMWFARDMLFFKPEAVAFLTDRTVEEVLAYQPPH